MSIIKFNPEKLEEIAEFLDNVPDFDDMDAHVLRQYRKETEQMIAALNELEPRNQNSDAYEQWAELHEDLEDVLDEILDCLEDLGEA